MRRNGPRSMTELMIDESTTVVQRPDAPYNLSDAATEVWRRIVASMPADHFAPSHYPMLVQLCRHEVESNCIAQLIEQCRSKKKLFSIIEYNMLLTALSRESAAINRLMRSMRLTHQALYRADSAKSRPAGMLVKAPWGSDEE